MARPARRGGLVSTSFFEVRVTDERGSGLADLLVVFALPDRPAAVVTDAEGLARVDGVPAGEGAVRLDVAAVRAALAERWHGPPAAPGPAPCFRLRTVDSAAAWTPIRSGERQTLAFRSLLRKVEVPGDAFEPGEAFVLPAAFPAVRLAHRLLLGAPARKIMLFAHAEAGGDELAAKRRSELRAEALFALLAHRAEVWEGLWHGAQWKLRPRVLLTILEALGYRPDQRFARKAIERFQADHPPLRADGVADPETRAALFLAYFRLASEVPVAEERIVGPAAGAPFMGCGAFNSPLEGSGARRVDIFVFDAALAPAPPCRIGNVGPCHAAAAADEEGPLRCAAYREIAGAALATEEEDAGAEPRGAPPVAAEEPPPAPPARHAEARREDAAAPPPPPLEPPPDDSRGD